MNEDKDVRYDVILDLRESILRVVDHFRTNRPELYSKLQQQLEEYRGIIEKRENSPKKNFRASEYSICEYISRIAKTVKEAGFEYVTDMDGFKLFRKRK